MGGERGAGRRDRVEGVATYMRAWMPLTTYHGGLFLGGTGRARNVGLLEGI